MRFWVLAIFTLLNSLPLLAQLVSDSPLEKECDSGLASACWQLLGGIDDSAKKPDEHFKYSKKLCDLKDDDGCFQLAYNYYYLKGNTKQGIKIMTELCKKKHTTACKELVDYKKSESLLTNTKPLTNSVDDEINYYEKKCNLKTYVPAHDCFSLASIYAQKNDVEKKDKAIQILRVLCFKKHPQACEKATQIEGGQQDFENMAKYEKALKLSNTTNIKTLTKALKTVSDFCKLNFSNSCENQVILKSNLTNLKANQIQNKPEVTSQDQALKKLMDQEVDCRNGNGEMCWGLYMANRNNPANAAHYLKAGCSVGHEKSCMVKKNFDEEQRVAAQQLQNIQTQQSEANKQAYQRKKCATKNSQYAMSDYECSSECPGYNECVRSVEALNPKAPKNLNINCTTTQLGNTQYTSCN